MSSLDSTFLKLRKITLVFYNTLNDEAVDLAE
jgi:hypothetical protein